MSIIGRTFEQAIKQGQNSMEGHLAKITALMETIITNENEIIVQQKKICDKLGIGAEVEKWTKNKKKKLKS